MSLVGTRPILQDELNNVQSSLLFILRFLIQLLGGIVIGMLIGNFQKVIKRGKTQSEKKQ